jgi:predicted RNA-binding protein with PUA-like domain
MKSQKKQGFWLLKSEPDTFSILDLKKAPQQVTGWEGVRNYQARNMLKSDIHVGDLAFFYHSSCATPAIVGIVEVIEAPLPDLTAQDPKSQYYDPKATPADPRWFMVKVKLKEIFTDPITLTAIKANPALSDMALVRKGNRLSVMPVTANQWKSILSMAK